MKKSRRQKYTYVPNESIENVITTNSSFSGEELLDGVYIKGRKKFKHGGKTIKKMSNAAVARKIMELDAKTWEDLDIQSGSQLREDKKLQQKYIDRMAEADKLMARAKDKNAVLDILEDENYHSAWGYFSYGGKALYADGGQTPSRRMRTINQRASEMVGQEVWDDLSVDDQADLVADYVADGVLAVPLADGGYMVRKRPMGELMPTIRKRGEEFIVYSRTHGIHTFDSKEKAENFIKEVKKDMMMLTANLDEDFYGYAKGGQMMAKGAEVADAESFVVTYEMNGKKKEKTFDNKEVADAYVELLGEDEDVTKVEIKSGKSKKASAATPSVNLFAAPSAAAKPKKTTKDKVDVPIKGLASTIARFDELKEIIKNAEAEKEILDGKLKEIGKDNFLQMYEDEGFRPKNFNMVDGDESVLYVMSDNYKGSRYGVSTEKAQMLEPYGVLESTTTYTINADVLNKPGVAEAISKMIMQSKVLTEEDKLSLIKAETKTVVKKGTIDRLLQFDNPAMIFDLIEPVVSLK
jgi:hypothetical protein